MRRRRVGRLLSAGCLLLPRVAHADFNRADHATELAAAQELALAQREHAAYVAEVEAKAGQGRGAYGKAAAAASGVDMHYHADSYKPANFEDFLRTRLHYDNNLEAGGASGAAPPDQFKSTVKVYKDGKLLEPVRKAEPARTGAKVSHNPGSSP